MTARNLRAWAARMNSLLDGSFEGYLMGVDTFAECATALIEEMIEKVEELEYEVDELKKDHAHSLTELESARASGYDVERVLIGHREGKD